MKSPGIIYRRYRQIKKKLLYEKMVASRVVCHRNCHYGKLATIDEDGRKITLPTCTFSLDGKPSIDICSKPTECNAYSPKWTKEKVIEEFNNELSTWETKIKLYPELMLFEWILDKDLNDAQKEPSLMGRIIVAMIGFLERILKYVEAHGKTIE